ncbi:hypothetical protein [Amycolatopsis sp. NPDC059021]|uniref:hypothetical protein n=1 Tax=Amycolatopsis sp. NPDC059021 TaxID=3346704 RepID=UPI0036705F7A
MPDHDVLERPPAHPPAEEQGLGTALLVGGLLAAVEIAETAAGLVLSASGLVDTGYPIPEDPAAPPRGE